MNQRFNREYNHKEDFEEDFEEESDEEYKEYDLNNRYFNNHYNHEEEYEEDENSTPDNTMIINEMLNEILQVNTPSHSLETNYTLVKKPTKYHYENYLENIYNQFVEARSLYTNRDWYDMFYRNISFEYPVIFYNMYHSDEQFNSQCFIADNIIYKMVANGSKHLVTFDSFGRFTMSFLHMLEVNGFDMNEWTVELVVERNEDMYVRRWQNIFLPNSIVYNMVHDYANIIDQEYLDDENKYLYINLPFIEYKKKNNMYNYLSKFDNKNLCISYSQAGTPKNVHYTTSNNGDRLTLTSRGLTKILTGNSDRLYGAIDFRKAVYDGRKIRKISNDTEFNNCGDNFWKGLSGEIIIERRNIVTIIY